ncbi:MAG: protein translocase SEC61 complex subunit gamma [Candidatus Hodarchaeales archaeon]
MSFFTDSVRLIKIARKPFRQEIWLIIKVTTVSIILLGLIGFVIQVVGNVVINEIIKNQ